MHDQREVHGHGVIAFVDHGFGKIKRGDACALEPGIVKQSLMHTHAVKSWTHMFFQASLHVIGVQHRIF